MCACVPLECVHACVGTRHGVHACMRLQLHLNPTQVRARAHTHLCTCIGTHNHGSTHTHKHTHPIQHAQTYTHPHTTAVLCAARTGRRRGHGAHEHSLWRRPLHDRRGSRSCHRTRGLSLLPRPPRALRSPRVRVCIGQPLDMHTWLDAYVCVLARGGAGVQVRHVERLREMSPLWEMVQEGIDIKKIEWVAH